MSILHTLRALANYLLAAAAWPPLFTIGRKLVNAKFQVLAKLFAKPLEIILVLHSMAANHLYFPLSRLSFLSITDNIHLLQNAQAQRDLAKCRLQLVKGQNTVGRSLEKWQLSTHLGHWRAVHYLLLSWGSSCTLYTNLGHWQTVQHRLETAQ